MNRILVILGVALIVVLTALFALPALIDWSRYRSSFEEQASRLLGRPVRVGEHVRLRLLPSPYISFDNVRVADASGRFDTPMLRMESFKLQLAVGPLLTGNLVAQDVEVVAPVLRLSVGADGEGNWVGLGHPVAGAAAADLKGLALNAVHIERGSVDLVGTANRQSLHLDAISGDLDAPSLQGPFRFKGTIANGETTSDLRFSAEQEDSSGKLRIKSSWRSGADGAQSYSIDGVADGLETTPSLTGRIEAQFPLAAGPADKKSAAAKIELKANLLATPDSAKLSALDILLDSDGKPQHLTGSATLGWRDGSASDANLAALTLDLDRLAGGPAKPSPMQTVKALYDQFADAFPQSKDVHVQLHIGEATIGGGAVSTVTLAAKFTGAGLMIESLSAKLPGQSHLDTSGALSGPASAAKYDGTIRLWGANFGALANWAVPGLMLTDTGNVSTYLFDSSVFADSEHVLAEKLRLELSGTTVTGSVRYAALPAPSLSVALDSGRLDLTRLLETPLNLAAIAAPTDDPAPAAATPDDSPWTALRSVLAGDTHLDLRIGHLITAQGSLRDVSARLDRSNGRLNIPAIDLATDDGFKLHLEGALQAKGSDGQGQLRLMLAAPDQKAMAGAIKFAGLTNSFEGYESRLAAITPLSLAGTIAIGAKSSASQEMALDGAANGSRLTVTLRRDGQDTDWLGSQVDLAADLANSDSGRLLTQISQLLGSTQVLPPQPVAAPVPGKLVLRSSGVPDDSMTTVIALESEPATARFDGQATYGAKGQIGLEGHLDFDAKDASTALRFARLERLEPALRGPLKLSGRLHKDADVLSLASATASLAGETVTGDGRLTGGQRLPKLEINLQAPVLRLNHLLALLVANPGGVTNAVKPSDLPASVWPEQPFDFAATEGLESQLSAMATRLVLTDALTLSEAKVTLASKPGSAEFWLLQGHGLSGDVSGEAKLTKAPAGAALQAQAVFSKVHLDRLGTERSGLPRPGGDFGLALNVSGAGLSPRDLTGSLSGKGKFTLGDGGIARFAPGSIDTVARDALTGQPGAAGGAMKIALAKARLAGDFPMLGANGSLSIGDGSIRFDRLKVDSSQSELEIANRIDLTTLQLSSVWALQPKPAQSDKPALPAVTFSFSGPLAGFSAVEPAIDTTGLERDLTNRKLLGGPEQLQGIWPSGLTSPPTASISTTPLIEPAPQDPPPAVAPTAAAALPATAVPPGLIPAMGQLPSTTASLPVADQNAAALDAAAKKAASLSARPHRKKADWASALFQSLFGK